MGRVTWHPEQFREQAAALVLDGGRASTPFGGCGESPGTTRSSSMSERFVGDGRLRLSGRLETSRRIGVWPDSVQVSGGKLSSGLPTRLRVWLTSGLQPVGHRDEAWLQRGLPCS